MFRFIDDLSPAKRWFQANIDEILRVYGDHHPIQREDILLGTQLSEVCLWRQTSLTHIPVICTLDAANYALFVSHHHPDSLVR